MKRNGNLTGYYDRAVVAPSYPVGAGIRSNKVPPSRINQIESFDKETTEADRGRLRISFLRIQVERSSNRRILRYIFKIKGNKTSYVKFWPMSGILLLE